MTMTINEKQNEIIEDFDVFSEWEDKYRYIIDLGNDLPKIDDKFKTDDNLIRGCQSRVWLHVEAKDGKLFFSYRLKSKI